MWAGAEVMEEGGEAEARERQWKLLGRLSRTYSLGLSALAMVGLLLALPGLSWPHLSLPGRCFAPTKPKHLPFHTDRSGALWWVCTSLLTCISSAPSVPALSASCQFCSPFQTGPGLLCDVTSDLPAPQHLVYIPSLLPLGLAHTS